MKPTNYISILLTSIISVSATAQTFTHRGPGGGGALFSPSINPNNSNEFYVACDMSELFHTSDFGNHYETYHFNKIQSGTKSKMCFSNNTQRLYNVDYANDKVVPVRSDDGGNSWYELTGNPDTYEETFGLWCDYYQPDHLVLAYYGQIYFSGNGGSSFSLVRNAANSNVGLHVAGVFMEGQNIYIATNEGLISSHDGGVIFSDENYSGIPSTDCFLSFCGAKQNGATRFFAVTANSSDIYAGIGGSDYYQLYKGVYKFDVGDTNWTFSGSGIAPNLQYLMFVDMAINDTSTAYIAGSNDYFHPNVFKTSNGGQTWTKAFNSLNNQNVMTGWCGTGGDRDWGYAECLFGIDVCKLNSQKVIVTDYGFVHKSNNGGSTWQQAYTDTTHQHAVNTNTGQGQNYSSCGLENTSCWQVFWSDNSHLIAGYSDIRGTLSSDGGNAWNFNYTGHTENTMYRIAKNISNSTIYAATSTIHDIYQSTRLQDATLDASNADGKIIFSSNHGSTWQTLHDFNHPVYWVANDPNNINRLYASVINYTQNEGGIWVSNNINAGTTSTWTRISPPGRTEGHPANIIVLNDGTVVTTYSGRRNSSGAFTQSSGVFIYNPGLQQWSDKSDNGMFYWTNDIVIDPTDANQNTWYVSVFSGWGGAPNNLGGLYKTTDRGNTWTRIFNSDRVSSCTFNPNNQNQLYVTTEQEGLWICNNIHSTNPVFNQVTTYPFRQPVRVFFNPYNTTEMWVTSFGNGIQTTAVAPTAVIENEMLRSEIIKLKPNPAKNTVTVQTENKINHIEVFDVYGKFLQTYYNATIDLQETPVGIYYLHIYTIKGKSVEKLIVQ